VLDKVDISATAAVGTFSAASATATQDAVSQNARAGLVAQYNQIIDQITTTAQDASFNGVNLLNGDTLKMVFDETGKSTVTIAGVTFDPAGLGLSKLTAGTDLIDNFSTNNVLTALNTASITLRSQASAFGANLSIVQIRQDFNKNLINVLQTGSSALTLADSNEEAANSQALSTRQSIATSALSLANQSQQAVLQLLR
jgi:flagellin-like hook-associated protein FlgL